MQQAVAADVNGRFVVWMETPGTSLNVLPWTLYAHDRAGSPRWTRRLTTAPSIAGQAPPPPPGNTGPVLSDGRVFWAQVSGPPGHEQVDVFGCQIVRCRPQRVAAGAAFPAASSEALYVITTDRFAGENDSHSFTVERISLASGVVSTVATIKLARGQVPLGLAATEHHVAWIVAGRSRDAITIMDRRSGRRISAVSEKGGGFGYPVVTDRLVAWAESSGVSDADVGGYVYDIPARALYSVGNTAGLYNVAAAADVIAWQMSKTPAARPEDIVNVVGRLR